MAGFDQLLKASVLATRILVGNLDAANPALQQMWQRIQDLILDLPPVAQAAPTTVSPADLYVQELLRAVIEINASLENLRNIEVFMSRFPYRGLKITRAAHLRYHLENHLGEVYLLKERLIAFATVLARRFRKDPRHVEIVERLDKLKAEIVETLGGIVGVRGRHIHERRFSDPDLDRLETMDTLVEHPIDEELTPLLLTPFLPDPPVFAHVELQRVTDNNKAIRDLVDGYSLHVLAIAFPGKDDALVLPASIREKSKPEVPFHTIFRRNTLAGAIQLVESTSDITLAACRAAPRPPGLLRKRRPNRNAAVHDVRAVGSGSPSPWWQIGGCEDGDGDAASRLISKLLIALSQRVGFESLPFNPRICVAQMRWPPCEHYNVARKGEQQ